MFLLTSSTRRGVAGRSNSVDAVVDDQKVKERRRSVDG
jgi:hypothetical protein